MPTCLSLRLMMVLRLLAETLIHETVHAMIDKDHSHNAQWNQAQQQDIAFISTYAESHPFREDLA